MAMFDVTLLAVTKVIVAVLVGAYTANTIPHRASTIRDFSFLISNVLLPSLTIANTAKLVTVELLVRCSVLVFFALLLIGIGITTALLMSLTMFRPPKAECGIPLELQADVRFELCYDPVVESDASATRTTDDKESKRTKKGTPYVAVVLSEALRARGVTGEDVVPLLDIPSPEMEAQPGYIWGSLVGNSIQNTVTLPLSLLQNLSESVPWVRFEEGSAYIFIFSTVCTLYLWSFGPFYVETAQKQSAELRLIREIVTAHKRRTQQCDACTQTEVKANSTFSPVAQNGAVSNFPSHTDAAGAAPARTSRTSSTNEYPLPHASLSTAVAGTAGSSSTSPVDSTTRADTVATATSVTTAASSLVTHESSQADFGSPSTAAVPKFFAPTEALCEQLPYDWVRAGLLRPVYAADIASAEDKPNRVAALLHAVKSVGWRLLTNVPFMAIVVSIFIGTVAPVRALFFDDGALVVLMDSIAMIAQGSVPSSLLLLGVNLSGSAGPQSTRDSEADRQLRHSEQNTDFPLYAQDLELVGEDATHAAWYNEQHAHLAGDAEEDLSGAEFDPHASFSLQDLIQRNADVRERELQARGPSRRTRFVREDYPNVVAISVGTETRPSGASASHSHEAVSTELAAPAESSVLSRVKAALTVEGVRMLFIWGTIAMRLVALPAISFCVLLALIKTVPSLFGPAENQDKTLILVLFLELAAPTAINSTLLFNQRQYMTYAWAKMLFFQYILCSVTLVMWATVGLAFVQTL